jgi:hypothetical protein
VPAHIAHPSTHTHGLADGCLRCGEHAEHPFDSLDDDNLADLVARTKRWMADDPEAVARSKNEQKAMTRVADALQQRAILERIEATA